MNLSERELSPVICFQFTSNSIHLAASLEILESLVKENKTSIQYYWLGSSTSYPSTMSRGLDRPFRKVGVFPKSIKRALLTMNSSNIKMYSRFSKKTNISSSLDALMAQCKNYISIQDLSNLEDNGISPGGAIVNSFVSETGRWTIEYPRDESLLRLLITSYLEIYHAVIQILEEEKPTAVVIYNGRFLHERATWDACRRLGVDVHLFETTRNRFHVRVNHGFHDRILNQKMMKEFWSLREKEMDSELIEQLGSKYFLDLESNKNLFYSKESLRNLRESYFVYYSNSDDEAIGFWESWRTTSFSQIEIIQLLQKLFETEENSHLYVRLHPNLANKSKEEQDRWRVLKNSSSTTIIWETEKFSSYQLLKGAKGVISFGSTIGLEAAFHMIPSAILADCWYDELDVADKLKSFEELVNWIEFVKEGVDQQLLVQRKRNSLIRGLWLEMAGSPFMNCKITEIRWGSWEATHYKHVKLQRIGLKVFFSILNNKLKRLRRGLKP